MAQRATAAQPAPSQSPRIVFDSSNAGLIKIVEEEVQGETTSPLLSPSLQIPTWRDVDFLGNRTNETLKGLGVMSISDAGSTSLTSSKASSPATSPKVASPRITALGWGIVPPRQISPLSALSPVQSPNGTLINQNSYFTRNHSSTIPDIHEAIRKGSVADIEVALRKGSVALPQALDTHHETKSNIEILITEESDVLGPLHSPVTGPMTPSLRTSLAPTSPRASSDCLGRGMFSDDSSVGTATPPMRKSPRMDSSGVFRKLSTFADLHSFSFGQGSKARKESNVGHDPISSPQLNRETSIQRPVSAHLSLRTSIDSEASHDVMLINPVTGERKMSIVRPGSAGEQLRRPSILRKESSTPAPSMYTMVRRESVATARVRTSSTTSRPGSSGRNLSTVSDHRHLSVASAQHRRTSSFAADRRPRNLSSSTRHMSSASNARTLSNARTMSNASYARTMSNARNNSTWSRTMSTFSRASSMTSMSTYDEEPSRKPDQQSEDCVPTAELIEPARRKSSFFAPLFGNFHWSKRDSAVAFPVQEIELTPQEGLADVEEDPDFVEVEIRPKAGSISRRASLIANVFTNKDIDVDPDLEFEPSASEKQIKRDIAEAQAARSYRKLIYSRNVVATSLVVVNSICIALSFGLLSVWYALIPLVMAAPFLRSVMVLDLLRMSVYKRASALWRPRKEPEIESMEYASIVAFSSESYEEMESNLDAIANQQGVDMHKHMLMVSCNDQIIDDNRAKSTTRILLEHILTNIVDEAKFQIPREDDEYEFTTLWCRRGIYKGLPYILMVKEGVTGATETLDMARNLLHAYNCRKQHSTHTIPAAFFAWYREWAELHDFASFDFLVSASSNTTLDPTCISELYLQLLQDPQCVGVSSLVKVNSQSHKWHLGNLYQNAQYMRDQLVKQSHQSQITHRTTAVPGSCQMLKICDQTCGPDLTKVIKDRRPSAMSNILSKIRSIGTQDNLIQSACCGPEVSTKQAISAVVYTRPSTTISNFLGQNQHSALSDCALNLNNASDARMTWLERISASAELLTWCLPIFSLALIANFLRAAALQQNIPVLIVLAVIVTLPWLYPFLSALWVSPSWDERLRHVLGFFLLMVLSPFVAVFAVGSAVANLHLLGKRRDGFVKNGSVEVKTYSSNV